MFVIDAAGNYSVQSTAILTVDNTAPTNQDTVFATSVTKQGGAAVTIVSSADATNNVWFAPSGTTVFSAGATMTTAGGTATSILAPATAGAYRMFAIDAAGNYSAQSTAILTVDNTAPTSPTGVGVTPVGGTVIANTLNTTNTHMTAVATITAGQATNGYAELLVGGVVKLTDSTILAGDTTVTFTTSDASPTNAELQAAIAAGGVVTVKVYDEAGNNATSSVSNPTLVVDYTAPSNQNTVFAASITKQGGLLLTIVSSADATNNVWFAPVELQYLVQEQQ